MNQAAKSLIFFLLIVAILFITFIFRATIFSGKVILQGAHPYQILLPGKSEIPCLREQCSLRLPIGTQSLIIQKEKSSPILLQPKIGWLSKETFQLNFSRVPQLSQTQDYAPPQKFQTTLQESTLISPSGSKIAIFPKHISGETINNQNYTLLISEETYLIDHLTKTKTKLKGTIPDFQTAALSPKANYIIINSANTLKLLSLQNPSHTFDIKTLFPQVPNGGFLWLNNEKLIFASKTEFTKLQPNENSLRPIEFTIGNADYYSFFTFDPTTYSYELLATFPEISLAPEILGLSNLEEILYLQTENQQYQISL